MKFTIMLNSDLINSNKLIVPSGLNYIAGDGYGEYK
jgi:hypothetical protein